MEIVPLLQKEFEQECETIRKFIGRVPEEAFEWKPHDKSMSLKDLAVHLAGLLSWVEKAVDEDELDVLAGGSQQKSINNAEDLKQAFEVTYKKGKAALGQASEEDLEQEWTLRKGDKVLAVWTKYEAIRTALDHAIHHRAQLGVYFRLLDMPVPATYFRSADDQTY